MEAWILEDRKKRIRKYIFQIVAFASSRAQEYLDTRKYIIAFSTFATL